MDDLVPAQQLEIENVAPIRTDQCNAYMTLDAFYMLPLYSRWFEDNAAAGRRWKRREDGEWKMGWFSEHPQDRNYLNVNYRKIIISQ